MDAEPAYVISVVSRLLQMHPQTLRKYERVGLVRPSRSSGMLRLYSERDIRRLRLIKHLVDNVGLNLAGVELVLDLHARLERLREQMAGKSAARTDLLDQSLNELFAALEEQP